MPKMRAETRLRHIYDRRGKMVQHNRRDEDTEFLLTVVGAMERRRLELDIPIRSIRVIRYLAENPSARIFSDPVTEEAFSFAMRSVMI